jgi:hypothetical protein
VGTGEARGRPVTRAGAARRRRKGKARRLRCLSRGGASGAGELREEEGKADKRAPLVSCPRRKVKGRCEEVGWVGPERPWAAWAALWRKEGEKLGWAVHVWAGGL